jgi:hypothetical protein
MMGSHEASTLISSDKAHQLIEKLGQLQAFMLKAEAEMKDKDAEIERLKVELREAYSPVRGLDCA